MSTYVIVKKKFIPEYNQSEFDLKYDNDNDKFIEMEITFWLFNYSPL